MGLLDTMQRESYSVVQYENKELQEKALSLIPVDELEDAAVKRMRLLQKEVRDKKLSDTDLPEIRDLLLLELLSWFKNTFFTWVDEPPCDFCSGKTKFSSSSRSGTAFPYTRVEVFVCELCQKPTEFIRHEDPWILLETRRGRCGEWANCFTLLCRAMGWDVRRVVDVTDHVWTEVFSVSQDRWIHCDPCENESDKPLMYEQGWGKKLSYIIAYSCEDVQDVTWRYSCNHSEVLKRRQECSEAQLLEKVFQLRSDRQFELTKARKAYVTRRLLKELVEFMSPRTQSEIFEGRTSGSLAWRIARGEMNKEKSIGGYVWKPTVAEKQHKKMEIMYSCVLDSYIRPTSNGEVLEHWQNGVFKAESVFRKEEKDWKKVYLARTEKSSKATVSWKIDCQKSGLVIDKIAVHCESTVFETGKIRLKMCGNVCVTIPSDHTVFETEELSGSETIEISAELSGGDGTNAWQHAQLFRQSLDNKSEFPFNITIYLKEISTTIK